MRVMPTRRDPIRSVALTGGKLHYIGMAPTRATPTPGAVSGGAPAQTQIPVQLEPLQVVLKYNEKCVPGMLVFDETSLSLELRCNNEPLFAAATIPVQLRCKQIIHNARVKNKEPIHIELTCNKQKVSSTQTQSEEPIRIEVKLNEIYLYEALLAFEKSLCVELKCYKIFDILSVVVLCNKITVCNAKFCSEIPLQLELNRDKIPILAKLLHNDTSVDTTTVGTSLSNVTQVNDTTKHIEVPAQNTPVPSALHCKQSPSNIQTAKAAKGEVIQNKQIHNLGPDVQDLSKISTVQQLVGNAFRKDGIGLEEIPVDSLALKPATEINTSTKFNISDDSVQKEFKSLTLSKKQNEKGTRKNKHQPSAKLHMTSILAPLKVDSLVKPYTDVDLLLQNGAQAYSAKYNNKSARNSLVANELTSHKIRILRNKQVTRHKQVPNLQRHKLLCDLKKSTVPEVAVNSLSNDAKDSRNKPIVSVFESLEHASEVINKSSKFSATLDNALEAQNEFKNIRLHVSENKQRSYTNMDVTPTISPLQIIALVIPNTNVDLPGCSATEKQLPSNNTNLCKIQAEKGDLMLDMHKDKLSLALQDSSKSVTCQKLADKIFSNYTEVSEEVPSELLKHPELNKSTQYAKSDNSFQEHVELKSSRLPIKQGQSDGKIQSLTIDVSSPISPLRIDLAVSPSTDIDIPDHSGNKNDLSDNNMMREPLTLKSGPTLKKTEIVEKDNVKLLRSFVKSEKHLLASKRRVVSYEYNTSKLAENSKLTLSRPLEHCVSTQSPKKPKIKHDPIIVSLDLSKIYPNLKHNLDPCDSRIACAPENNKLLPNKFKNKSISEKILHRMSSCARNSPGQKKTKVVMTGEYPSRRKAVSGSSSKQSKHNNLDFKEVQQNSPNKNMESHLFLELGNRRYLENDCYKKSNAMETTYASAGIVVTEELPNIEIWGQYPKAKAEHKVSQECNSFKQGSDYHTSRRFSYVDLDMPRIEDFPTTYAERPKCTTHIISEVYPPVTKKLNVTSNLTTNVRSKQLEISPKCNSSINEVFYPNKPNKIDQRRISDGIRKSLKSQIPSSCSGKNSALHSADEAHSKYSASENMDSFPKDYFKGTDLYLDPVTLLPRTIVTDDDEQELIKRKVDIDYPKISLSSKNTNHRSKVEDIPEIPETVEPISLNTEKTNEKTNKPQFSLDSVQRRHSQYIHKPEAELSVLSVKDRLRQEWLRTFIPKPGRRRRHESVPNNADRVQIEFLSPRSTSIDEMKKSVLTAVSQPNKTSGKRKTQFGVYPFHGGADLSKSFEIVKIDSVNMEGSSTSEDNSKIGLVSLKKQLSKESPKIVSPRVDQNIQKNDIEDISLSTVSSQPLEICEIRHSKVHMNPRSGATNKNCKHNSQTTENLTALASESVEQKDFVFADLRQDSFTPESSSSFPVFDVFSPSENNDDNEKVVEMKMETNSNASQASNLTCVKSNDSQCQIGEYSCSQPEPFIPIISCSQSFPSITKDSQSIDFIFEDNENNDNDTPKIASAELDQMLASHVTTSVPASSLPSLLYQTETKITLSHKNNLESSEKEINHDLVSEHYAFQTEPCNRSALYVTIPGLDNSEADTSEISDNLLMLQPLDLSTKKKLSPGDEIFNETNEDRVTLAVNDVLGVSSRMEDDYLNHIHYVEEKYEMQNCKVLNAVKSLPCLVDKDFLISVTPKKKISPAFTSSHNYIQNLYKIKDERLALKNESNKRTSHVRILEDKIIKRPENNSYNEANFMTESSALTSCLMPTSISQTESDMSPLELTTAPVNRSDSDKAEECAPLVVNYQDESTTDWESPVFANNTSDSCTGDIEDIPLPTVAADGQACNISLLDIPLPSGDLKCSNTTGGDEEELKRNTPTMFDVDDDVNAQLQSCELDVPTIFIYKPDAPVVRASMLPADTTILRIDKCQIPLSVFDEYLVLTDADIPCRGCTYYTLAPYDDVMEVIMDDMSVDYVCDNNEFGSDLNNTKNENDVSLTSHNNFPRGSYLNNNAEIQNNNHIRNYDLNSNIIEGNENYYNTDKAYNGDAAQVCGNIKYRMKSEKETVEREVNRYKDKVEELTNCITSPTKCSHKILSVVSTGECFHKLANRTAQLLLLATSSGRAAPLLRIVRGDRLKLYADIDKAVLLDLALQLNACLPARE